MTSDWTQAGVFVFSCLFCCSSPPNVALSPLFQPKITAACCVTGAFGIEILLNNSDLPPPRAPFTPWHERNQFCYLHFHAWMYFPSGNMNSLSGVKSQCCCVLECTSHSFHLQPSMYVFIRTLSSALPPPASPAWVQPPVKTQTHHCVVNKLMLELFPWLSEVNEGFLASTNLQFHRDYSPGKVAVEATGWAPGAREFWPCGDIKILPSVGACMQIIPCPRWSFQQLTAAGTTVVLVSNDIWRGAPSHIVNLTHWVRCPFPHTCNDTIQRCNGEPLNYVAFRLNWSLIEVIYIMNKSRTPWIPQVKYSCCSTNSNAN